jgi:hypothetical protein
MNASKTKAVWVGNKKYSDLILCPESNLHWSPNFERARDFITVIFPINVSFLCCQLFKIAETSLIFFEK